MSTTMTTSQEGERPSGSSTPSKSSRDRPGEPNTPRSKRSVNFDPFDVEALWQEKKKKVGDVRGADDNPKPGPVELTVASLKHGEKYVNQPLRLRVTAVVPFDPRNGGKPCMKFYGKDATGEVGVVSFEWDTKKFLDVLKVGATVSIVNFTVKADEQNITPVLDNKLGIRMMYSGEIGIFSGELPDIEFKFTDIAEVQSLERGKLIDVLGVVDKNWGMEEGPHGRRRDLTLCDASGTCVFTLWKYAADIFGEKEGVVLAVKHAAIGSYGGKQALSNWSITGIMESPETKEASDLLGVYHEKKERVQMMLQELESGTEEQE